MTEPRVAVAAPSVADAAAARRTHFGAFYGEEDPPEGFGLVVGNCQAESLRIIIDPERLATVRMPAVHELTRGDARRLHELLPRASFLVSQPVRDDYHDLPLGTRQLRAALRGGVPSLTVTPIRFAGLYPFQFVMRVPGVDALPPLVEYHDVRNLAEAAGLTISSVVDAATVRAIAADSLGELRRREATTDVPISDLFQRPSFAQMRTINHPGNSVFLPVAERIVGLLGHGLQATDPGRPLLSAVEAPREQWVIDAWGRDSSGPGSSDPDASAPDEEPRPHWRVDGHDVPTDAVREAHLQWYGQHPQFVDAALKRTAPLLARWGAN